MPADTGNPEIERRAAQIASQLDRAAPSFSDARLRVEQEYLDLLGALRGIDERFAFDREGRPDAIRAVREALPLMERDLFDAIVDDHACEVAAIEEALYQVVRVLARLPEKA